MYRGCLLYDDGAVRAAFVVASGAPERAPHRKECFTTVSSVLSGRSWLRWCCFFFVLAVGRTRCCVGVLALPFDVHCTDFYIFPCMRMFVLSETSAMANGFVNAR